MIPAPGYVEMIVSAKVGDIGAYVKMHAPLRIAFDDGLGSDAVTQVLVTLERKVLEAMYGPINWKASRFEVSDAKQ